MDVKHDHINSFCLPAAALRIVFKVASMEQVLYHQPQRQERLESILSLICGRKLTWLVGT